MRDLSILRAGGGSTTLGGLGRSPGGYPRPGARAAGVRRAVPVSLMSFCDIASCSYLWYPAAGGVGPTAEETATPGASGPFHIARCLRMRFERAVAAARGQEARDAGGKRRGPPTGAVVGRGSNSSYYGPPSRVKNESFTLAFQPWQNRPRFSSSRGLS